MKFDQIQNLQVPIKKYSKKEIKKIDISLNIKSFCRYGNLAIILMEPGVKGSLRELSRLVNDGIKPCSWIARISFYENDWMVSIAPHDEINKADININVYDNINSSFKDISILGNAHAAFLKTKEKKEVEDIINYLISVFYNLEIQGIQNFNVNKNFSIQEGSIPYHIKYEYSTKEKDKTIIKNKELIDSILQYDISQEDKDLLENIIDKLQENKVADNELLNYLSQKYCNDKERLHIAIKFMS